MVVSLPVQVGGQALTLSLSSAALDGLVHLLDRSQPLDGAGATLSLDGVESLLTALLAPLTSIRLDTAIWAASNTTSLYPLDTGAAWRLEGEGFNLDVAGATDAVASLADLLAAHGEQRIAAPLSYLRAAAAERLAVPVEWMNGYTVLSPEALAAMVPGGAVTLDAFWPEPRTMVARRFIATAGPGHEWPERWQVEPVCGLDILFVRRAETVRLLDEPDLLGHPSGLGESDGEAVALVGPAGVIAHGRLRTLDAMMPVFLIENMGEP